MSGLGGMLPLFSIFDLREGPLSISGFVRTRLALLIEVQKQAPFSEPLFVYRRTEVGAISILLLLHKARPFI